MTRDTTQVGKRWKVTGAVVAALLGLVITSNDDLYNQLGLGPQQRMPYQLLGTLGCGYCGALIGKALDRRRLRRQSGGQADRAGTDHAT